MLILHLIVATLVTRPGEPPAAPSPEEVVRAAVAARTGIRNLHATFEIVGWQTTGKESKWAVGHTFWKEGDKVRVDIVDRSAGPDGRFVECRNCERPGWGVVVPGRAGAGVNVFRIGGPGALGLSRCIDPRGLGYYPERFCFLSDRIDACVGMADRGPLTVTDEPLDGVPCRRLHWTSKVGVTFDAWVCPAQGNNVVRIEGASDPAGRPSVRLSLRSEVVRVEGGVWFPQKVVFDLVEDGQPTAHEEIIVTEVRVNQPALAPAFTLAGIGLEDGRPVMMPGPAGIGLWNAQAGAVVPYKPGRSQQVDTTPAVPVGGDPPAADRPMWVAVAAGVVVLLIGVIVVRRRRGG